MAQQRIKNWIRETTLSKDYSLVLDLSNLDLTELPILPDNLQILYCYYNNLTSLPNNLPDNLQVLNCSRNQLTSLPILPNTIQVLYCNYNQLTSLPEHLPNNLKELNCSRNQLTSLPEHLPNNLKELNCSHNQLVSLPENLPITLEELNCIDNRLTQLPLLSSLSNLKKLYCKNNLFVTPLQIPYNVKTDLNPTEYVIIKPNIIGTSEIEKYVDKDISFIIDEYIGDTCNMLSEYGDKCSYKTLYTKQYVDKDGVLIPSNTDEINTLIKFGFNPKIVNKKYNCVNYCKQHCNFAINKLYDTNNKYITVYSNNEPIIKGNIDLKYKIKTLEGTETELSLYDLCKDDNNYRVELYIKLQLTDIPDNYKIKFEEHGKEIRYVSNTRWKLIKAINTIYAFIEYDLIYNE